MQNKIIFLFQLLLFCSLGHSDLGSKVENINSNVRKAGVPSRDCTHCAVPVAGKGADPGILMKSCVELICPQKDFSLSEAFKQIYDQSLKSNSLYSKELQPLISAVTREDAQNDQLIASSILEWAKNPKDVDKSGAIQFINLIIAVKDFSKFKFKNEKGDFVIDPKASREAFAHLSDKDYAKNVQAGNRMMEVFSRPVLQGADPSHIKLHYGDDFKKEIDQVFRKASILWLQIQGNPEFSFLGRFESFKEALPNAKLKEEILGSDTVNMDAITRLNQSYSFLALVNSLATDTKFRDLMSSGPIDMERMMAERKTQVKLSEVLQRAQKTLREETVHSGQCRAAFEMGQQLLPTEAEIKKFQKRIDEFKKDFFNQNKELICESDIKQFQSQIASWSMQWPLSKEQHLVLMKKNLNREIEQNRLRRKFFAGDTQSSDKDVIYAISAETMPNVEGNEVTNDADTICENMMPEVLPDAAASLRNSFVVGPMTLRRPDAVEILYHEFAHKMYDQIAENKLCMDSNRFQKVRSCLLSMHTELSSLEMKEEVEKVRQNQEATFEAEDFADLVAAQTGTSHHNFACLFTREAKDEDYSDLSLREKEHFGPHSSNLFRLLHMNFIKKGKTPTQCQSALAARGEKAHFKNCFQ